MAVKDSLIGQQFGAYRITDLVGRGGMGSVYRAWDEGLRRELALKVLRLDRTADPRETERFAREVRLAARLSHPNIVSVYGAGSEEGYLYLAMELVEGDSLRALLRRRKTSLPIEQALAIGAQILAGLQAAHERAIIHRDIKPENILLKADNTVKVVDFGVAKLEGGTVLTRADEILGTVEYMAPEQILGDDLGPAVDLYATGAVLYEMLTGALPFSGDSPATLVYHQLNEEPHAPSFLNPSVPRALDRFVLRLLDKLPENRPPSAAAALEVLGEIQHRQQFVRIPGLETTEEVTEGEGEFRSRDFRPRFTGRHAEFGELTAHFDALAEGGRVVFIAGEAGIGKTRLVEHLGRYAAEHGGWMVQGVCFFEHGLGPYMPFLDAIGNLLQKAVETLSAAEQEELRRLLAQQAPELAELATSASTTAKIRASFAAAFSAETSLEAARQRLFDAIFALLSAAAAVHPLVLLLEDMHWADEGSLQLLQYLVRRAPEARVLCAVTYRPEELAGKEEEIAPLATVLQQLHAAGLLCQVRLDRLQPDELEHLVKSLFLEAEFAGDFIDFLYEQSQGNPFIAVEVLRLLRHQDVLYCDSGIWSVRAGFAEVVVPDRINALVMRRIDQLDTTHRELLQLAAVLGQRFSSRLLEAASGMPRIALLKALFRLEKRNQLITSAKGSYEFSHAKIREVLYAETSWELRREYHRIIAAILEGQQEQGEAIEAEELGTHLYRAEEFARAMPHLIRGGDEAFALFGWRRAALLFDQAVEACRQSGAEAGSLLHALRFSGLSYSYLTAYDQALERCAQLGEAARAAGRPQEEAGAWNLTGQVNEQLERFADADAAYEKALAAIGTQEAPSLKGRISINWGCADFRRGRYAGAEARWRAALALALGRAPRETADALNNLAVLATVRGDLEGAWGLYEQVLALDAQTAPSPHSLLTYYNMGMVRADQQRWDEALQLYDRSLQLCQQTRHLIHEPAIDLNRTEALIGKGDLAAAREACSRALRGFRRLDNGLGLADALRLYGRLCRLERNWDDSQVYLEKSVALNRQFGESVSLGEALYELGLLHQEAGRPQAAMEPLHTAREIFTRAEATLDLDRVRTALAELSAA